MGDCNFLSAYKLINSELVLSNQKLKNEIKGDIEMINALNKELFTYREENKTLRDMVQKLLEQFTTVTTIMVSIRDKSESVLNTLYSEHASKKKDQQSRKPLADLFLGKRRTECPSYVDKAAIVEVEDENRSMEDYRSVNVEEEREDEVNELGENEKEEQEKSIAPSKGLLVKRLERKSRNSSLDESFETIDTNRVIMAARKSQEYLQCFRDSREGRLSEKEIIREISGGEDSDSSRTMAAPVIVENATVADGNLEGKSAICKSIQHVSSFSNNRSIPSDQNTLSELYIKTDQSLRPVSMTRMTSDSMLTPLIQQERNKENITLANDTISNALSSASVVKKCHKKLALTLKPLTKEHLSQRNIFYEGLLANTNKPIKLNKLDSCSDKKSIESRRPRRKAAPKVLKEQGRKLKLRRV